MTSAPIVQRKTAAVRQMEEITKPGAAVLTPEPEVDIFVRTAPQYQSALTYIC
jgi:hypothetical protein